MNFFLKLKVNLELNEEIIKVELIVSNLELFIRYLGAINRLVPSCRFDINSEGCNVMGLYEFKTIRAFFTTNILTSDETTSFCLDELQKFLKSMQTVGEFEDSIQPLTYDGTFLKYSNQVKFKQNSLTCQNCENNINNVIYYYHCMCMNE